MGLSHKIRINVVDDDGNKETVLENGVCSLSYRLIRFLFGGSAQVLVLNPGQSVDSVEVFQVKRTDTG